MREAEGVNTSVTAPQRAERYYDRVSYPTLLLQLLSRASGLLSRPPRMGGQDVLAVVAAADTIETIYYSLPSQLRNMVDNRLREKHGDVVKALTKCYSDWRESLLKGKVSNVTKVSALISLRKALDSGVLPLFLYKIVRYTVDENGVVAGADVIDLSPCVEAFLGSSGARPSHVIEGLVELYNKLVSGSSIAPNRSLMYACINGLRLRAKAALTVIVDVLDEAGLLLERGMVWIGEA